MSQAAQDSGEVLDEGSSHELILPDHTLSVECSACLPRLNRVGTGNKGPLITTTTNTMLEVPY